MCVPGFIYLLLRDVTDKGYSISLDLPWGHVLKSHLHIDDLCLKSLFFFFLGGGGWGWKMKSQNAESRLSILVWKSGSFYVSLYIF